MSTQVRYFGQIPTVPAGPADPQDTALLVGPEIITTRRGFVAIPTEDMRAFLQMQAFTFLAGAAAGFIGGFVAATLFGWTPQGMKK